MSLLLGGKANPLRFRDAHKVPLTPRARLRCEHPAGAACRGWGCDCLPGCCPQPDPPGRCRELPVPPGRSRGFSPLRQRRWCPPDVPLQRDPSAPLRPGRPPGRPLGRPRAGSGGRGAAGTDLRAAAPEHSSTASPRLWRWSPAAARSATSGAAPWPGGAGCSSSAAPHAAPGSPAQRPRPLSSPGTGGGGHMGPRGSPAAPQPRHRRPGRAALPSPERRPPRPRAELPPPASLPPFLSTRPAPAALRPPSLPRAAAPAGRGRCSELRPGSCPDRHPAPLGLRHHRRPGTPRPNSVSPLVPVALIWELSGQAPAAARLSAPAAASRSLDSDRELPAATPALPPQRCERPASAAPGRGHPPRGDRKPGWQRAAFFPGGCSRCFAHASTFAERRFGVFFPEA